MRTNLDAPCVELHVGVIGHKGVLHQLCQHMPPCTNQAMRVDALTTGGPKQFLGTIAMTSPHKYFLYKGFQSLHLLCF